MNNELSFEYHEGYKDYCEGFIHCPYPLESQDWYDWHEGWDQAEQDELDKL
jgi:ribosome modulation factor